jgi:hypothetical protein
MVSGRYADSQYKYILLFWLKNKFSKNLTQNDLQSKKYNGVIYFLRLFVECGWIIILDRSPLLFFSDHFGHLGNNLSRKSESTLAQSLFPKPHVK